MEVPQRVKGDKKERDKMQILKGRSTILMIEMKEIGKGWPRVENATKCSDTTPHPCVLNRQEQ